ncbi:MAG: conjugative transfer protein MobI(A/C) [Acidiferrobacteraceae bacterium]
MTPPKFQDQIQTLIQQELAELKAQAERLADAYWTWRIAEDKKRPARERSRLGLRVRGTARGSWSAEWYAFEWRATREGSRQRFRGLAKGTGDRYPDRVLSAQAKGWEWPRVQSLEDELAELRRRAKLLGKLRFLTARFERPDSGEAAGRAPTASARARAS